MKQEQIKNFCIIAHIDHGKSTLADRFLELTKTVEKRDMQEQVLDQMDLERERGITIKLAPVRMRYQDYQLNLIDTPGHVDFTYEVSRSLAAVEGAVLLVDATKGIQAQTLANLYLALEQDLEIIPVINKIDLAAARVKEVKADIVKLLGVKEDEILSISAKTGEGVQEVLKKIIKKVPDPKIQKDEDSRALIFDSTFDEYRGVLAYIRVFEGELKKGDTVHLLTAKKKLEILDIGCFSPKYSSLSSLKSGEIGYIATGLKEVSEIGVGDTVSNNKDQTALAGYKEVKPMVWAGIFCQEGSDYESLKEAIEKIKLNDAALIYEKESSPALGFGFRCGFLGMLHIDIFTERLKREFDLDLIITVPSVAYKVYSTKGEMKVISSAQNFPDPTLIDKSEEPWMKVDVLTPKEYMGNVMELINEKRGVPQSNSMEYLDERRVVLHYYMPLSGIIVDFYDRLKNVSSGYASLSYEFYEYQPAVVVKMDILVADDKIDSLSTIIYKDEAHIAGKKIVAALKKTLHRQQFVVKIQAALGGKIIAAERISALRKDVTANLYGGDVTRKRKVLEKQKKGKKRMKDQGKVIIPKEAFMAVLKR